MKFFTPQVAWHNRDPVLSVDIQSRPITRGSTSYRAVTSGQDSHVVIWKIALLENVPGTAAAPATQKPTQEPIDPTTKAEGEPAGAAAGPKPLGAETQEKHQDVIDIEQEPANSSKKILLESSTAIKSNGHSTTHNPNPNLHTKNDIRMECLADLNHHLKSVNCVRFSPVPPYPIDGPVTQEILDHPQYLASCDDDAIVCIWRYIPEESYGGSGSTKSAVAATVFGLDEDLVQVEKWQLFKTLRGHVQDVLDLCWSPDGKHLLSCSVDNTTILWDVARGSKVIMTEAKLPVQGVAWDPRSKYFAALSQDRNLRIYHSTGKSVAFRNHKLAVNLPTSSGAGGKSNAHQEIKSLLFYDSSLPSYCRRLNFTHGGELLLVPSGVIEPPKPAGGAGDTSTTTSSPNQNQPNAAAAPAEPPKIINCVHAFLRDPINQVAAYYPTEKYSLAVRACPVRFTLKAGPKAPGMFPFAYRIVFAVATKDSILFYDTQQAAPFAFVSQIHYARPSDISWSPDGRLLLVSSMDGFCTFITFKAGELGEPYHGPVHSFEPVPAPTPAAADSKDQQQPQTTPEKEKTDKEHAGKTPDRTHSKSAKGAGGRNTPSAAGATTPAGPAAAAAAAVAATPESMGMKDIKNFFKITPRRIQTTLISTTPTSRPNPPPQNSTNGPDRPNGPSRPNNTPTTNGEQVNNHTTTTPTTTNTQPEIVTITTPEPPTITDAVPPAVAVVPPAMVGLAPTVALPQADTTAKKPPVVVDEIICLD